MSWRMLWVEFFPLSKHGSRGWALCWGCDATGAIFPTLLGRFPDVSCFGFARRQRWLFNLGVPTKFSLW